MDFRKLLGIVLGIGVLGVIASVAWWYSFYSNVVGKVRGSATMSDMLSCLYFSDAIQCKASGLGAQFAGSTPYNPVVFWVSVVVLIVGVALKFSLKK